MSRAPVYVSPPPPDSAALRASTKRYKAHNDRISAGGAQPACTCAPPCPVHGARR